MKYEPPSYDKLLVDSLRIHKKIGELKSKNTSWSSFFCFPDLTSKNGTTITLLIQVIASRLDEYQAPVALKMLSSEKETREHQILLGAYIFAFFSLNQSITNHETVCHLLELLNIPEGAEVSSDSIGRYLNAFQTFIEERADNSNDASIFKLLPSNYSNTMAEVTAHIEGNESINIYPRKVIESVKRCIWDGYEQAVTLLGVSR